MRLSIDHVSVGDLLRDVSLSIEAGELVCVLSERRATRVALLSVAAKASRPDTGSVETYSRPVLAQTTWPQRGTALLDQLIIPLLASPRSVAQARSRALGFLAELGLEDWAGAALSDLEDYQLARLSLMRALISEPDVLLADDPTEGLESGYAEATLDLLRLARDRGAAVLLTTATRHAMQDADGLFTIVQGTLRGEHSAHAQVIPLRSTG